jgi:nitrogen fixation protein FixH
MKTTTWFSNPWPVGLVIFFTIFISYIAGFITFASRQRMDLVRADYYDQEIRFQKQIDRVQRTAPIMAAAAMAYDAQAKTVTLKFPPAMAAAGVAGAVNFYRPSNADLDHNITLAPDHFGAQSISIRGFQPGRWKVRIQWTCQGQDYYFEQPLIIKREQT